MRRFLYLGLLFGLIGLLGACDLLTALQEEDDDEVPALRGLNYLEFTGAGGPSTDGGYTTEVLINSTMTADQINFVLNDSVDPGDVEAGTYRFDTLSEAPSTMSDINVVVGFNSTTFSVDYMASVAPRNVIETQGITLNQHDQIISGTVTVSKSSSEYTFEWNLDLSDGGSIRGSYTGSLDHGGSDGPDGVPSIDGLDTLNLEYFGLGADGAYRTDVFISSSVDSGMIYMSLNDNSDSRDVDAGTYVLTSLSSTASTMTGVIVMVGADGAAIDYAASELSRDVFIDRYGFTPSSYDRIAMGAVAVSNVGTDYTLEWNLALWGGDVIAGSYTGSVDLYSGHFPIDLNTTYDNQSIGSSGDRYYTFIAGSASAGAHSIEVTNLASNIDWMLFHGSEADQMFLDLSNTNTDNADEVKIITLTPGERYWLNIVEESGLGSSSFDLVINN